MIKITVNSQALTLYSETSIQLEINSSIFTTGDIEGEYTYSFEVPARENIGVFGLVGDVRVMNREKSFVADVYYSGVLLFSGNMFIQRATAERLTVGIVARVFPEGFLEGSLRDYDFGTMKVWSSDDARKTEFCNFLKSTNTANSVVKFPLFLCTDFYKDNPYWGFWDGLQNSFNVGEVGLDKFYVNRAFFDSDGEVIDDEIVRLLNDNYNPTAVTFAPALQLLYIVRKMIEAGGCYSSGTLFDDTKLANVFHQSLTAIDRQNKRFDLAVNAKIIANISPFNFNVWIKDDEVYYRWDEELYFYRPSEGGTAYPVRTSEGDNVYFANKEAFGVVFTADLANTMYDISLEAHVDKDALALSETWIPFDPEYLPDGYYLQEKTLLLCGIIPVRCFPDYVYSYNESFDDESCYMFTFPGESAAYARFYDNPDLDEFLLTIGGAKRLLFNYDMMLTRGTKYVFEVVKVTLTRLEDSPLPGTIRWEIKKSDSFFLNDINVSAPVNYFEKDLHIVDHLPGLTNGEFLKGVKNFAGSAIFFDANAGRVELDRIVDVLQGDALDLDSYVVNGYDLNIRDEDLHEYTLESVSSGNIGEQREIIEVDNIETIGTVANKDVVYYVKSLNCYVGFTDVVDDRWIGNYEKICGNDAQLGNGSNISVPAQTGVMKKIDGSYSTSRVLELDSEGNSVLFSNVKDEDKLLLVNVRDELSNLNIERALKAYKYQVASPLGDDSSYWLSGAGRGSVGDELIAEWMRVLEVNEEITLWLRLPVWKLLELFRLLKPQDCGVHDKKRFVVVRDVKLLPKKISCELRTGNEVLTKVVGVRI